MRVQNSRFKTQETKLFLLVKGALTLDHFVERGEGTTGVPKIFFMFSA